MAAVEAGIKTFLIADVRGYTRFTQEHGDEAAARLATRFAQLAREAIEAAGGTVVELRGDEVLAVFDSARQALRTAADLQELFAAETVADPSLPLAVGIGLDAGEAVVVEGGYRGGALNLAARLCSLAEPGEVLVSPGLAHLARKVEGLDYIERGAVRLKGLEKPIEVVAVRRERKDAARELLGREHETARIDRLLAGACQGQSGALVLSGEPGIGKTALLEYAVGRATEMIILTARGIESEAELPFVALADLLRPATGLIERIPEAQAAALQAALALGPPAAGDRFTVCAGVLSLLAVAADESPVLVLIDDAHSVDRSSMQAVLFAARRLDAEGIAVLIARRSGSDLDVSGLPELELQGLTHAAAAALLERAGAVAPSVADELIAASGANPLALIEVPSLLTEAQLAGTEPMDGPIPTGDALERAFMQRVAKLPEPTQRALVVAAASGSSDFDEIIAAAERAGLEPDSLDAAEGAGLTIVDGSRFAFAHPLLRSAVYHGATALVRRAAHAALAGGSDERRPWHLAAAADEPDAALAAELQQSASTASARGGHAEAAASLEIAARLAEGDDARARLLLEAADEAWRGGQTARALGLLDDALAHASDRGLAARLQHLYGVIEMWSGSPRAAYERLTTEAERIASTDARRSARLLTDAAWAAFMAGEVIAGRAAAERATAHIEGGGGFAEALASGLLGIALLLNGERGRADPLLRRYQPLLDDRRFLQRNYAVAWPAALALVWMEEHAEARAIFERVIERAREQSVPTLLPYALVGLAELDFRTGGWARAYANAAEAVTLSRETGQPVALAFALACLARIEAAQGRDADCREHATEAFDLADGGAAVVYAAAALGLLELGAGRADEAIEHLTRVQTEVEAHGLLLPTVIQWAPDLIEALARAGRRDEAAEVLVSFEHAAESSLSTWALGAAARCRGLLADPDEFETDFSRAVELQEAFGAPFELARTELGLGERLRRARRRKEARGALRAAIDRFERLGAAPWADRAKAELRASGETIQPGAVIATNELTPQELQVALAVAKGATNREAGAALFLSPKTIEAHLGHVYRKLAIRSRTELAALLAREDALTAA